ncbi:hypothetical protein B9Z55_000740 [Caenorhabditis nigoni]|uniref:TRAM domain-containing protein n=1 Tax=Caenorhabditis nigoni TaxID=1611254 RepID=A0A2G5VUM1_9PELO|nr:hypothetical protein B9Z55_000740 [Caenorhabditis nigoni]
MLVEKRANTRNMTLFQTKNLQKSQIPIVFLQFVDKIHGVGHNKSYEQILVPLEHCKMGEWSEVRITSVTKFSMISTPTSLPKEDDVDFLPWKNSILDVLLPNDPLHARSILPLLLRSLRLARFLGDVASVFGRFGYRRF